MIWLLLIHFVTDFLLQPRRIAETKSTNMKSLLIHGAIIFAGFLIISIEFAAINAVIHMVIDRFIWNLYKVSVRVRCLAATAENYQYWKDGWFYHTIGLDQFLHVATLVILAEVL